MGGPSRTVVHTFLGLTGASGVGVRRTLLGPGVAFRWKGREPSEELLFCQLSKNSAEKDWDIVAMVWQWEQWCVVDVEVVEFLEGWGGGLVALLSAILGR